MKFRYFYLFIFFLISIDTSAQKIEDVEFTNSKEIKFKYQSEEPFMKALVNDNHKIMVTKVPYVHKLKTYWVKFEEGKEPYHETFGAPYKDSYAKNFFNFGNRIFWSMDKKDNKDLYDLVVEYNHYGKPINVVAIDSFDITDHEKMNNQHVRYSPDSSKVLLLNWLDEDKYRKDFSIRAFVLDENMNVVKSHLDYDDSSKSIQRMRSIGGSQVFNDGSFVILEKRHIDKPDDVKKVNKKKVANYYLNVTYVESNGEVNSMKLPNVGGFYDTYDILHFKGSGSLVVVAPKRSSDDDSTYKGFDIFVKKKDENNFSHIERLFSDDELEDFGRWDKRDAGFEKWSRLWPIMLEHNGKISFLLEHFGFKNKGNSYENYIGSALLTTINSDGEIENIDFFPKFCSTDFLQSQSVPIMYNGKIAILTKDQERNEDYDFSEYYKIHKHRRFKSRNFYYVMYRDSDNKLIKEKYPADDKLIFYSDLYYKSKSGGVTFPVLKIKGILQLPKLYFTTLK